MRDGEWSAHGEWVAEFCAEQPEELEPLFRVLPEGNAETVARIHNEMLAKIEPEPRYVIRVCRWCLSTNLNGARHEVSVSDGTEDGADVACLWMCGHEVRDREAQCGACHPVEAAF